MRAWAEVSLANIKENCELIRSNVDGAMICAVVKADAYGHGATAVAKALEPMVDYFAVATVDECAALRSSGITKPMLTLGISESDRAVEIADLSLDQTVGSLEYARELSAALAGSGRKIAVHFAVDTGMSRLGFETDADMLECSAEAICTAAALSNIEPRGIFTHFATSEIPGEEFQAEQLARFEKLLDMLHDKGLSFPIVHASNSGAILNIAPARFNMVRPGILLYGVSPDRDVAPAAGLKPAMSLKTRLVQTHEYSGAMSASYGRRFRSEGPIRTGTVSIGYADGLHRALSTKLEVLVRGKKVPQIGNICMDMMIIDLTNCPEAKAGDTVTVFGADGGSCIAIEEVAEKAGSIPYEIMCAPNARVARVYID